MGLPNSDPGYMQETKAPLLYTVIFSLLGCSVTVVALRLFCRLWVIKSIQAADYMISIALILAVGQAVTNHIQILTGMGKHVEFSFEHPDLFIESLKAGYANNIIYQASLWFIKSSILSLYYRIASVGAQRKLIVGVWIFVTCFCAACTLSVTLQCLPISAGFNPKTFPHGCYNITLFNFISSSINIATDITIFVLPIPILAKINMTRNKKIALFLTFSIGGFAVVASILRVQSLVTWNGTADFTFDASVIPLWNAVEVNAGIISASLPPLKPLFRKALDGTLLSSGHKRSRSRRNDDNNTVGTARVVPIRLSSLKPKAWGGDPNATDEEALVDTPAIFSGRGVPMQRVVIDSPSPGKEAIVDDSDTSWFKEEVEGGEGGIVVNVTYTVESEEEKGHRKGQDSKSGVEVVVEGGHRRGDSRGRQ